MNELAIPRTKKQSFPVTNGSVTNYVVHHDSACNKAFDREHGWTGTHDWSAYYHIPNTNIVQAECTTCAKLTRKISHD